MLFVRTQKIFRGSTISGLGAVRAPHRMARLSKHTHRLAPHNENNNHNHTKSLVIPSSSGCEKHWGREGATRPSGLAPSVDCRSPPLRPADRTRSLKRASFSNKNSPHPLITHHLLIQTVGLLCERCVLRKLFSMF